MSTCIPGSKTQRTRASGHPKRASESLTDLQTDRQRRRRRRGRTAAHRGSAWLGHSACLEDFGFAQYPSILRLQFCNVRCPYLHLERQLVQEPPDCRCDLGTPMAGRQVVSSMVLIPPSNTSNPGLKKREKKKKKKKKTGVGEGLESRRPWQSSAPAAPVDSGRRSRPRYPLRCRTPAHTLPT